MNPAGADEVRSRAGRALRFLPREEAARLVAVLETGTFTAAAGKLGVNPDTVSRTWHKRREALAPLVSLLLREITGN